MRLENQHDSYASLLDYDSDLESTFARVAPYTLCSVCGLRRVYRFSSPLESGCLEIACFAQSVRTTD